MLAGLDIGTTGCKITVYDETGRYQYRAYSDYKITRDKEGHHLDALELLSSVKEVIKEACKEYSCIKAIGIDSFGESFVMLDKDDNPLTPVIMLTDDRGHEELEDVVNKISLKEMEEITGLKPQVSYSLAKILWVKNNKPEIYNKVKRILLMEDYIVYMLTKNACIDYTLATRSLMFDFRLCDWSSKILKVTGIDKSLLSKPMKIGSIAGNITSTIKEELAITNDIAIVLAGHDQVAVSIGSGSIEEGHAVDGMGTCDCITPVYRNLDNMHKLIDNNYAIVPHYKEGCYVTYAYTYTSGSLISWFVENFTDKKEDAIERLENGFINEPTGILCLPYFEGAAIPYMDNNVRGAFMNLSLEANKSLMYQAILEGISFEMKLNIDTLKKGNVNIKKIMATGGGAKSKKWLQLKADIFGVPIYKSNFTEAGARGCAMLAGIACNVYNSLEEAIKTFVRFEEVYKPNKENHKKYNVIYKKYKKMYKMAKGVF